jgi:hypothetical protein
VAAPGLASWASSDDAPMENRRWEVGHGQSRTEANKGRFATLAASFGAVIRGGWRVKGALGMGG